MRPTRHGLLVAVGAAGLVAVGRFLGLPELFAIGAAIAMLVVACGLWVSTRAIDVVVARSVRPSRVHVGNPCTVEVQVRNRGRRTSPVLRLHDPVTGTAGADLLLAPIPLRKVAKVAYRLPTTNRGLVTVGPMMVEVTDPFGLTTARNRASGPVEITVLPRIDEIPPLARTVGPDPDGGAETGSLGRVGEDFAALRPYVIGDDLRRVHWPSSARTDDDLLVRQDDIPWQGRICVVLDLRRENHDVDTIERAVSAVASILRTHLRRGDHVRMVSTTGVDTGYGTGASHLDGILEYLAIADRSGRGTMHGALDLAERGATGALVVVTGRPSGPDLDAVEAIGPSISLRRIVRLDIADRSSTSRRTQVLGVPPGASFADAWIEATPSSGRTSATRRASVRRRTAAR
ncbi:DUF58 domain-containing protein [Actinospongicola halichondriae]|uniref:DUF58 domain-containing protein n=1 Tax=Actinospongicola halichondriae TaxID=3236844 RepID=UPI003D4E5E36